MLVTNKAQAEDLQKQFPNSFRAAQDLVVVLAKCKANKGKISFLGTAKDKKHLEKLEETIRLMIISFAKDRVISKEETSAECQVKLERFLQWFALAFPNWQDAYSFFYEYSSENAKSVSISIQYTLDYLHDTYG